MSYLDNFNKALEKEKKKKQTNLTRSYTAEYERLMRYEQETAEEEEEKDSWFKAGGFDDGVDSVGDFFVDLGETVGGTVADFGLGVVKGAGRLIEGVVDLGAYGAAGIGSLFGADEFAQDAKEFAQTSYVDEWTKEFEQVTDRYSVLGNKGDMVSEGIGQVATILLTGGIAGAAGLGTAGATALTTGLVGASGMGSGMNEAYSMGATDEEAVTYGAIAGASEAITELIFGGLGKGAKAIGVGKGLSSADDILAKKVSSKFSSQIAKNFAEYSIKAGAEGTEEVLSGIMQAAGKKMTYMSEEEFSKILEDEDLLEQFVVGTVTSGFAQSGYVPGMQNGSLREANKTGRDFITGLTQNEQSVVDKVYNDALNEAKKNGETLTKKQQGDLYNTILDNLEHGQLDIDDIESVLGGDTYKAYKDHIDSTEALKTELAELRGMKSGEMTDLQTTRMNELKGMNLEDTTKRDGLRKQLDDTLSPLLQDSKLAEAYRDRARRGEAFQADLSQYDEKQRAAVERAIKSGVLNNTYKTHKFVELLSTIEADKGIVFDYTDNNKLRETGFAIEGKTINGFVKDGAVTINIHSEKALQSIVGHEITHILEGSDHYSALQSALFSYAESRGELESRRADLTKLYKDIDGSNIDAELTADLVGDYLFTDKGFIKNLTSNKSLFRKIYDEIKYLYKIATGKQLAEIEKVKREFDKAWKELNVEASTIENGETRLSVSEGENISADSNGNTLSKEQQEYFKDSKARDAEGRLIPLYHGTPNGGFTEFKLSEFFSSLMSKQGAGHYFTDKANAEQYTKPVNKSVGNGANPELYEVYLNITNPLEIRPDETTISKDSFKNIIRKGNYEWFRTDWMPFYADGNKTENQKLDFESLLDKYTDKVYRVSNGDGDILSEMTRAFKGGDDTILNAMRDALGYDGVRYTDKYGDIWVAWSAEQIKNTDNTNPTSNPDIRFSLSEAVEETKDLVAVHNLTEEKLLKSLKLGGLPMPSIAIARAKEGHSHYGRISLVFNKDTIDPRKRGNKVYSGDAWTPTYPQIDYKVSRDVVYEVQDKISELLAGTDYESAFGYLALDTDNVTDYLNRNGGNIYDAYGKKPAFRLAYLKDKGIELSLPSKQKRLSNRFDNEVVIKFAEKYGEEKIREINNSDSTSVFENYVPEIKEIVENYYSELIGEKMDWQIGLHDVYDILDASLQYFRKGVQSETENSSTTRQMIDEAVDEADYAKWLDNLFDGVIEKEGIRNNNDLFTPSGSRRSFEALHYEHTLENVVKAMRGSGEKGIGVFGGGNIFGASTTEYTSIANIKDAAKTRLRDMSQEEYDAIREGFANRFFELASSLPIHKDSYTATDDAANMLIEAVTKFTTKSGMANYLRTESKGWANYSDYVVDDLIQLVSEIREMPTNYFEAKPQRAVGFNEVATAIIPDNTSAEVKKLLDDNGVIYVEYESGNEQARLEALNALEDVKFSISNIGEQSSTVGAPSKDLYFGEDVALTEDIAPIKTVDDIAPTKTVGKTKLSYADDIAPITEEEAVAINKENFDYLTDDDAPPEVAPHNDRLPDSISIDNKSLKQLSKSIGEELYIDKRASRKELEQVIQDFSRGKYSTKEELYSEIERRFGTLYIEERRSDVEEAKSIIKELPLYVSPQTKGDFGSGKDGYLGFMRKNFGKLKFSKSGLSADQIYQAMQETHPHLFPSDIWNEADQLRQIAEVVNMPVNDLIPEPLGSEAIQKATDFIYDSVREYQETERLTASLDMLDAPIDTSLMPPADDSVEYFAPFPDEIAPMTEAEANAVQDEKARSDAKAEGQPKTRKQLHHTIIEKIKSVFKEKGFDLDVVLRKAKNLSTFRTVDNTPQRVMEKSLGYKEGQVLADLTVNKVAQNETEGIKWLNSFTDRKNGLLAQISKQYNIKPGSKESAAAQMYAEGFYVTENNDIVAYGDAELAQDFPNATVRSNIKGLARDPRIRQIYDETLAKINESRARNAYPEIQKLDNYFLHFRAMDDTYSKIGLPFNPNDIRAKDLPTDWNGVTADLKPGQPYFASAMHRKGKRTSFDLFGGLERYLTNAKNQIYHIDDIQTFRALRNFLADTYGQANGLEGIDALTEEEAQERIEQVYGSHLSTFAKFLNEEANILAGKTALIDRGLEGIIGRRGITFLDTLNKQVGSNMVGFNVSSSLTNFIPVAQTFAKSNKADFVKAFAQTVSNKLGSIVGKSDGFAENSPVIIRRKGADSFYRTPFQKAADAGYVLMSAVDNISTELIARTKFNELTRKGMSEQQAHFETDKWVSRLMGDRSLGQMPQLYNSKTLGLVTKFQLEVRNQLDSQFYDTIQEAKVSNEDIENGLAKNAKIAAKVASTFVQLAVVQHLFGKAFESVAGYNPAFDIIEVLTKAFGFDDEEDSEDTTLDNLEQAFFELLGDLPYASTFTDGGRIPISSALPIKELINGEDEYGNEKSRVETLLEIAPYYALPGGYSQIKKTAQGLGMFSDEHPVAGSYTDSGNLRFPVEDTLGNRIQAGIFGQYASENAREYFDNGYAPLKEKQIQEYIDVEMPIADYWEYRKGLAKQETLEDKFDYIAGLDLTVEQKNILINNVVNRKEEVDLENYDDFSGLEEFDFATKSPEKYALSKSVGGYSSYKTYSEALYGIKADKDENGKSINGSRKEKVIAWLNELDADYETKIILFKSEYPADDTYNQEIIDYINARDDLTYDERVAIYTELGFTVKDGYVYWD